MKIFYFNDRKESCAVYVNDFNSTPVILKPAQGQVFEVDNLSAECIPFVKVWDNNSVLLSSMII